MYKIPNHPFASVDLDIRVSIPNPFYADPDMDPGFQFEIFADPDPGFEI